MEHSEMLKQAEKVQLAFFNLGMDAVSVLQKQSQAMATTCFDQTDRLSKSANQFYDDLVKNSKKGQAEIKKTVDDGYKLFQDFLNA